jgi:beta-phosphoglucomutase
MKQQYTMEIVYSRCKPIYYHEYALAKLRTDGYSLAVCSNSIRTTIEVMMERANLQKHLNFMVSAQDVVTGKPNPAIYQAAMSRLGLDPKECLILEDNENGIKAALASGAHLMRIATVEDTNYQNIKRRIMEIEEATC